MSTNEETWGGGLRTDWPPVGGAIIACPSCGKRHGKRYMCDARMATIIEHERKLPQKSED